MTTNWAWVQLFVRQLELCNLRPDESVVVLADVTTDRALVDTVTLAIQQLGCQVSLLTLPTARAATDQVAVNPVARAALVAADLVVDCTRPGLDHSKALTEVLEASTRILALDGEHPRDFDTLVPHPGLTRRVHHAMELLRGVELAVATTSGTRLRVGLRGAEVRGTWGSATEPGVIQRWPAGSVEVVPPDDTVSGTLVLMPGDVVSTARTHIRSPVTLVVEHDHICDIQGDSGDADLVRAQLEAFGCTEAYGVSSVGWGMALTDAERSTLPFDPDLVGPYAALLAGVVTVRTGSNPVAGRDSRGGIALALRGCDVSIDGIELIRRGELEGGLAPDVYELAARG